MAAPPGIVPLVAHVFFVSAVCVPGPTSTLLTTTLGLSACGPGLFRLGEVARVDNLIADMLLCPVSTRSTVPVIAKCCCRWVLCSRSLGRVVQSVDAERGFDTLLAATKGGWHTLFHKPFVCSPPRMVSGECILRLQLISLNIPVFPTHRGPSIPFHAQTVFWVLYYTGSTTAQHSYSNTSINSIIGPSRTAVHLHISTTTLCERSW